VSNRSVNKRPENALLRLELPRFALAFVLERQLLLRSREHLRVLLSLTNALEAAGVGFESTTTFAKRRRPSSAARHPSSLALVYRRELHPHTAPAFGEAREHVRANVSPAIWAHNEGIDAESTATVRPGAINDDRKWIRDGRTHACTIRHFALSCGKS
jgi:hypothetical protein